MLSFHYIGKWGSETMDNKKIIGIGLLALSLFLVLWGVGLNKELKQMEEKEDTLTNEYEKAKKEMNYTEDKKGANTEENKKKIAVKVINEFIYRINTKDYDKAYNLLDKEYREDFNITLDNFKRHYNYLTEKFIRYDKFDFTNTDESVVESFIIEKETDTFIKKTFTVMPNNEGQYKLADIGVNDITDYGLQKKAKKIFETTIIKEYDTREGYVYLVKLTNTSDESVSLSADSWAFYTVNGNNIKNYHRKIGYGEIQSNIVYPQESKIYRLLFRQDKYIENLYATLDNGEVFELFDTTSFFE